MTSDWARQLADQVAEAAEALREMDLAAPVEIQILSSASKVIRDAATKVAHEETWTSVGS